MNNADTALLKTRGKYEKALHEFHAATATQEKAIRAQLIAGGKLTRAAEELRKQRVVGWQPYSERRN
jgi:hypothetical protein